MASENSVNDHNEDPLVKHVTERWTKLNKSLGHVPKFQNENQTGVTEEQIKEVESKLNVTLPKEIRAVVKVRNGRKHIGYGLSYRLPSTDLLPISEWQPYEKEEFDFAEELFQCLADKTDTCVDKHLKEDVPEHLKVYLKSAEKVSKDEKITHNDVFQSLPCELLVIGRGMDDYAEEYLLSVRSGRIYLAVHNIPEWKLIGTFADWIEKGLVTSQELKDELKEQHDEAETD